MNIISASEQTGPLKITITNHLYLAIIIACFGIVGQMEYNDQVALAKVKQERDQQVAQNQQLQEVINYLANK